MRGAKWGRRQHWLIVLLAAGTTSVVGAMALGPFGAVAGIAVMAICW